MHKNPHQNAGNAIKETLFFKISSEACPQIPKFLSPYAYARSGHRLEFLVTAQEFLKAVPRHSAVPKISMLVVSPIYERCANFRQGKTETGRIKRIRISKQARASKRHLTGIKA